MTDNQMSSERSSDVAIKFQAAFRAAAERGAVSRYICPICSEPSNTGQELWEHAKQAHPESLEVIGSTEGVEAKELFLDKARQNRVKSLLQKKRKPQALKIRPEQSVSFLEESQKPIRLGTEQKLSDGDSPSEDKPPEGSEVEPEMLLQSDTGPISHEQLVVEVKGIYADLVMVEAKCIDIDERQSTAAQEKDLSKKVDLKNDEWQPVVALHKKLSHEHHDIFPASQHSSARSSFRQLNRAPKIKRGLPGFVNGSRTSALADTGAAQNVVSAAFVRERGLSINNNQSHFKVGNSKIVQSIGTVNMRWAFAEKPAELYDIVCHVLPQCSYDFILGQKFLTVTETFSKYRRRLAQCVFSVFDVLHLSFLDGARQTIDGKVGANQVFAVPDTGAERNVMNLDYAEALGFKINTRPNDKGFLQFADGTFQETVGQVHTTWTFASGKTIPVTFEVLENCSADVILGEDVLWENDVFRTHAASIQETPYENEDGLFDLSPFSYARKWEKKASEFKHKMLSKSNKRTHKEDPLEDEILERYETEERHRRDQWNHQYGFEGANASPAEKEAEARRRRSYDARIEAFRRQPPGPGSTAPLTSSTPITPSNTLAPSPAPSTDPRRAPPVIPSIPTAPNDVPIHSARADESGHRLPRPTAVVPSDNAPPIDPVIIDRIRRGLRF